jgi:hypothetical protein
VLSDIQIKDGDYQIQVHIIEARDLKAENMDGTSDPVVFVECFGQKQNTIVINQVRKCSNMYIYICIYILYVYYLYIIYILNVFCMFFCI